jgi:hypothetical protein
MYRSGKFMVFYTGGGEAVSLRHRQAGILGQLNWNQLTFTKFAPVLVVNVT